MNSPRVTTATGTTLAVLRARNAKTPPAARSSSTTAITIFRVRWRRVINGVTALPRSWPAPSLRGLACCRGARRTGGGRDGIRRVAQYNLPGGKAGANCDIDIGHCARRDRRLLEAAGRLHPDELRVAAGNNRVARNHQRIRFARQLDIYSS